MHLHGRAFCVIYLVHLGVSNLATTEANNKTNLKSVLSVSEASGLSNLLIPSLFPNVAPYIKFALPNEAKNILPQEIKESLIWSPWRLTTRSAIQSIERTGFIYQNQANWLGKYFFYYLPQIIKKPYQKINQVPGHGALESKTSMWLNIKNLQKRFGKEELDFVPETYVLPNELRQFIDAWERTENKLWIQKPSGGARSRGIQVIKHWEQAHSRRRVRVVQKYIQHPLLIDGVKTQIRLYAMATSFNPLRLFIQREIFLKFGVANYTEDEASVNDLCIHSTDFGRDNPKICKKYVVGKSGKLNPKLISRSGNEEDIRQLMREKNLNFEKFQEQLEDMVIKAVIAASPKIARACQENQLSRYNSYQFWAIDFVLDENFRPYLLEFNSVPTMRSSAKGVKRAAVADLKAKAQTGMFTVAGYQLPPTLSDAAKKLVVEELKLDTDNPTFVPEMYTFNLSKAARRKHEYFENIGINGRIEYLDKILEDLTPDDIRQLIIAEDERNRALLYKRVFPSPQMHKYIKYVNSKSYYYLLLDAWETKYGENRETGIARLSELTKLKLHLEP